MAAARKAWREAACMILAVGPYRYLGRPLLRADAQAVSLPVCMVVEKEEAEAESCELLFVKRSSETVFMVGSVLSCLSSRLHLPSPFLPLTFALLPPSIPFLDPSIPPSTFHSFSVPVPFPPSHSFSFTSSLLLGTEWAMNHVTS